MFLPSIAIILLLVPPCLGTTMTLNLLPKSNKPGGVCMDGTQAGYYYAPPASKSSSLWVVWLEGGGACYTLKTCTQRSKTDLGSSSSWKSTDELLQSFLSDDATLNPDFYDSHKVYVPYCSSDVHTGRITAANESTWNFYFSGHLNLVQIVDHVNQTIPAFKQKTAIMLSGSSAGGAGTFGNIDWLRSVVPSHVVVKGVPHAGFFFPGYTADQHTTASDVYLPPSLWARWSEGKTGGFPVASLLLWNPLLSEGCLKHWAPQGKEILCSSVVAYYPFIKTPLFILENQFDTNQIQAQLGCPKDNSDPQVQNFIAYFGQSMRASIAGPHMNKGDGFFLPSCFDHGSGLGAGTNVTIPGAPTQTELVGDWFFGRGKYSNYFVADNCEMQAPGLPCNPTCDGVSPAPTGCNDQLTKDGCSKDKGKMQCVACARLHTADLTKAGCTTKEVKTLCGY